MIVIHHYVVLLKLKTNELFVLSNHTGRWSAQKRRVLWRNDLGGKNWAYARRSDQYVFKNLALGIMDRENINAYLNNHSEVESGT